MAKTVQMEHVKGECDFLSRLIGGGCADCEAFAALCVDDALGHSTLPLCAVR